MSEKVVLEKSGTEKAVSEKNVVKGESFVWWQHQPYRLFLSARVLTTLAFQMQTVAVGWHMYDITRSAFDLGLIGLVQFLPSLLLTLVVGHVADRYDRRWILRIGQTVQFCVSASLAAGTYYGWLTRDAIFVLVFILGAARAFESPASSALLPQLVPTKWFPRAISLNSAAFQAAAIAGPALGGFVYVAGQTTVYCINAGLFLTASILIAFIRTHAPATIREPVKLTTLFAGIAFIRSHPVVLGAISLDMFAVLLGGATALLPIYAREILHTGPWGLGLLRAAPAVGALAMSLYLVKRPIERRSGHIMFAAVAIFGASTIVFALSESVVLSLLALLVLGASDMISVVIRSALIQLETPDEMRGRVSAVNWLFIGTSNQLGEFESGVTAAWFGVVPAALIGGAGTIAVVLWMRLFPSLASRDKLIRDDS